VVEGEEGIADAFQHFHDILWSLDGGQGAVARRQDSGWN
jgi:hypothetical protein